jgi:hypothetical protein
LMKIKAFFIYWNSSIGFHLWLVEKSRVFLMLGIFWFLKKYFLLMLIFLHKGKSEELVDYFNFASIQQ